MYAIVEVGGRQYRVSPGDRVLVERLAQPAGNSVELPVLLLSDDNGVSIGKPYVEGKTVTAKVLGEEKGKKLIIFKYTPKKRYRVKTGHRQKYTLLQILDGSQVASAAPAQTSAETANAGSDAAAA
jgi:large subunit ribosomal protein L21